MAIPTVFIILAVSLVAAPVFVLLTYSLARRGRKVRPTSIRTMKQGPNGRTVFETKSQPPVLPFTNQQAAQADRKSLKGTWQRLSRPFSIAQAPVESPVEMPKVPTNYRARESVVSPSTPKPMTTQSPVSPLSVSNLPPSSSITARITNIYQQADPTKTFDTIPLNSPQKTRPVQNGKPDPVSAFENPRPAPFPRAKLNDGSTEIKTNVVDASVNHVPILKLAQPPKVKKGWV